MPANTQNFRVKHGLEVQESSTFGNTVTISGNTQVTDRSLIITGAGNLSINAQGRALFGNTLSVSNGGINSYSFGTSSQALLATAANSSTSQSLLVNTSQITLSGNVITTGDTTLVSQTGTLRSNTSEVVLLSGVTGSPSSNVSFTIERGTSNDVKIIWDEATDNWRFTNDGTRYFPLRTYSSLVFAFDNNTTTAADPGNGRIRFNSTTYSSVTEIAIDLLDIGGTDISALLDSLDDSTSSSKAFLTFRSAENQDRFVVFRFAANVNTSTTGVRRFTVTHVSGGGTEFGANETIFFEYSIFGSTGTQGAQGAQGAQGNQGVAGPQGTGYTSLSSSSNVTIGTGSRTFVVNANNSTSAMGAGLRVRAAATSNTSLFVEGLISSFSGNTLVIASESTNGDGNTFSSWSIFAPGSFGPQGSTGPQGAQGAQGAQGVQGTTGQQGPQGAQGLTGPQGVQGTTGSLGPTGPQGITGPQGAQGAQGNQGVQGAQGIQGAQGAQGFQGAQGRQGAQGNRGGIRYNFATSTTDNDPGDGVIKYNNSTLSSVTFVYIDNVDQANNNLTSWYDTWDDSSDSTEGFLEILGNSSNVVNLFRITGSVQAATGYYKIPVEFIAGSLPTNGEALVVAFNRTGNVGAQGAQGAQGSQGNQGSFRTWTKIAANHTAVNGERLIGDTTAGSFNVTLPATPVTGNFVVITDGNDWSTNNLTVLRNGSTIEGLSEDLVLDVRSVTVEFLYDGSTWQVVTTAAQLGPQGPQGRQGAIGTQGAQGTAANISVSDDTTTNSTRYVAFTSSVSGNVSSFNISSSKLFYNPSTGTLSATNFSSLSDERRKENISTLTNALDTVLKLRGVSYTINNEKSIGLIAQEVQKILPEVVIELDDDIKTLTVSYDNIVGLLVEAIKDIKLELDQLKGNI